MGANDAFDDDEQLTAYIHDTKSFDKRRRSTISDARALVEDFRNLEEAGAWPSLERAEVADRLLELIGPASSDESGIADTAGRAVQQGAMNLCGPAAFFQFVIKRDPLMFATFATDLFDAGAGVLGALTVAPGREIQFADYASFLPRMGSARCPQADWMVLGGLRNSTDAFWTGSFRGDPDQELAAATRPGELEEWLNRTGLYENVVNEANWMTAAGIPHVEGLPLGEGADVAALINTDLIKAARNLPSDTSWPMTEFPNHWVTVVGQSGNDVTKDAVFFNIWSWGDALSLEVPTASFLQNYYGAVKARFAG